MDDEKRYMVLTNTIEYGRQRHFSALGNCTALHCTACRGWARSQQATQARERASDRHHFPEACECCLPACASPLSSSQNLPRPARRQLGTALRSKNRELAQVREPSPAEPTLPTCSHVVIRTGRGDVTSVPGRPTRRISSPGGRDGTGTLSLGLPQHLCCWMNPCWLAGTIQYKGRMLIRLAISKSLDRPYFLDYLCPRRGQQPAPK